MVLDQLSKPPFEPIQECDLKVLTLKTVFLLALASGKRRSEIHAWLHDCIRRQEKWKSVTLQPSPEFIAKNQLARDGPSSVAPVQIPALAPVVGRDLEGDRTLCPVRALRNYLKRTSDLRQGKKLLFVSFKKGFQKDICASTISSWIKQAIQLCYAQADDKTIEFHQVKAHDVRALAASRAFQGGVSVEQIMTACHWKSHNTFTNFYLKDLAMADREYLYLGPVVAAQQSLQQTSSAGFYVTPPS